MTFLELVYIKQEVTSILARQLPNDLINKRILDIEALKNINLKEINEAYGDIFNAGNTLLEKNRILGQLLENLLVELDNAVTNKGLELTRVPEYAEKFLDQSYDNFYIVEPDADTESIIKTKIQSYTSWQYPALYLHCAPGPNRVPYMVDADPLYLAGCNPDELEKLIQHFPELYQRRVRQYQVTREDFSLLPQEQFSFVLCWDFFNRLNVERIEVYLKNILKLLRPGGTVMFSYTNAELDHTATLVDEQSLPWATKSYINRLLIDLGYSNLTFTDVNCPPNQLDLSWVEATKPGQLKTVKRHQVLGAVHTK